MAGSKKMRHNRVLREFNISLDRAVEHLKSEGYEVEARPTTRISKEEYEVLFDAFQTDKSKKVESKEVGEEQRKEQEALRRAREEELEAQRKKREAAKVKVVKYRAEIEGPTKVGKIDLDAPAHYKKVKSTKPEKEPVATEAEKEKVEETKKEAPKKKVAEKKPTKSKEESKEKEQ